MSLRRATDLFTIEEPPSSLPIVSRFWRTRSVPDPAFLSIAEVRWEMVVTKQDGRLSLTVRGPETTATAVEIPQDAEFFGIQFALGTYMPSLSPGSLVDGDVTLPAAGRTSFWLAGAAWACPDASHADVLVERLVRRGLIVRDPMVEEALKREADAEWTQSRAGQSSQVAGSLDALPRMRDGAGASAALSRRSLERRFIRATGLSHGTLRQIARARQAVALLDAGTSILDTVVRAGYADQPHLTRALRRFIGQTPAQIVRDRDASRATRAPGEGPR